MEASIIPKHDQLLRTATTSSLSHYPVYEMYELICVKVTCTVADCTSYSRMPFLTAPFWIPYSFLFRSACLSYQTTEKGVWEIWFHSFALHLVDKVMFFPYFLVHDLRFVAVYFLNRKCNCFSFVNNL